MSYTLMLRKYTRFYGEYYKIKNKYNLDDAEKITLLFILLEIECTKKNKYSVYYYKDKYYMPYLTDFISRCGFVSYYDRVAYIIFKGLTREETIFLNPLLKLSNEQLRNRLENLDVELTYKKSNYLIWRSFIFSKKQYLSHNFIFKRLFLFIISCFELAYMYIYMVFFFQALLEQTALPMNEFILLSFLFIPNTFIWLYMYIKWLILPPKKKVKKKRK